MLVSGRVIIFFINTPDHLLKIPSLHVVQQNCQDTIRHTWGDISGEWECDKMAERWSGWMLNVVNEPPLNEETNRASNGRFHLDFTTDEITARYAVMWKYRWVLKRTRTGKQFPCRSTEKWCVFIGVGFLFPAPVFANTHDIRRILNQVLDECCLSRWASSMHLGIWSLKKKYPHPKKLGDTVDGSEIPNNHRKDV